jgi:hypothetical protein
VGDDGHVANVAAAGIGTDSSGLDVGRGWHGWGRGRRLSMSGGGGEGGVGRAGRRDDPGQSSIQDARMRA